MNLADTNFSDGFVVRSSSPNYIVLGSVPLRGTFIKCSRAEESLVNGLISLVIGLIRTETERSLSCV